MAKAKIDKLDMIHDKVATYYIEALDSGEELSSGTLAALNAFLKNNNITADVVESSPLQNLSFKIQDIIKAEEA